MRRNLLLTVFFGALLFNFACTAEESPKQAGKMAESGKDYLALFPENTNILFHANFDELRKTPFGEEVRDKFRTELEDEEEPEYRRFVEATGLDFERDVHQIWVGVTAGREREEKLGGAVVRGSFDRDRIIDYLKQEKPEEMSERTYRDHKIFVIRDKHGHDDEMEFAFLDAKTVIAGKTRWIETALDHADNGGKSVLDNPAMAKHFRDVPYKNQMWAILNLDELSDEWAEQVRKRGSSFEGTKSIENMRSILFYTKIEDRARMFMTGIFDTKEEAELVAEMLNGFKAMAKLMVSDDREAVDMLNEIEIKTDGSDLKVTANVDQKFFEKLKEKREKFSEKKVKMM